MSSIKYPFTADDSGLPAQSAGIDEAAEALKLLLETNRFELEGMNEFGVDAFQYVFDPNIPGVGSLLQAEISTAVERWLPNTIIRGINVETKENAMYLLVLHKQRDETEAFQLRVPMGVA